MCISTHRRQPAQFFHITFLVQSLLYKVPALGMVGARHAVGTCAAAIVALAIDEHVLEIRQIAADLMWHDPQRVATAIVILRLGAGSRGAVRMLQDRNKDFNQECRCNGRDSRPSHCALLIKSAVGDGLDTAKLFSMNN